MKDSVTVKDSEGVGVSVSDCVMFSVSEGLNDIEMLIVGVDVAMSELLGVGALVVECVFVMLDEAVIESVKMGDAEMDLVMPLLLSDSDTVSTNDNDPDKESVPDSEAECERVAERERDLVSEELSLTDCDTVFVWD